MWDHCQNVDKNKELLLDNTFIEILQINNFLFCCCHQAIYQMFINSFQNKQRNEKKIVICKKEY